MDMVLCCCCWSWWCCMLHCSPGKMPFHLTMYRTCTLLLMTIKKLWILIVADSVLSMFIRRLFCHLSCSEACHDQSFEIIRPAQILNKLIKTSSKQHSKQLISPLCLQESPVGHTQEELETVQTTWGWDWTHTRVSAHSWLQIWLKLIDMNCHCVTSVSDLALAGFSTEILKEECRVSN